MFAIRLERDRLAGMVAVEAFAAGSKKLYDAPETLAPVDARRAKVIELPFLGRLSVAEPPDVLRSVPWSVMRNCSWRGADCARELGSVRKSSPEL
jgi:hypothetical protein